MSDQSTTRRATFPPDYGNRGGEGDDTVAWAAIEAKLETAPNYWLTTIGPNGRPHDRPVDGVWVDGALVFGGSPDTRWVRNLQANPAVSVHRPSGDDVVILEGEIELVVDEGLALLLREPEPHPLLVLRERHVHDLSHPQLQPPPHDRLVRPLQPSGQPAHVLDRHHTDSMAGHP